jgi:acylphosphatase
LNGAGDRLCLKVVVTGRVQGVWFRGWTIEEARARGLDGWVRNRSNGSVEALFSGPSAAVRSMVEACRRGPPGALVTSLYQEAAPPPPEGEGFHRLSTV